MKLPRAWFARLLQYVGVAMAAHAVTMHALVLRYARESGDGHPDVGRSWVHVSIGVILAAAFFVTGVCLERRSRKQADHVAR